MQSAIHGTDQSKLLLMMVLPSKFRSLLYLALRDFGMLSPHSDSLRLASSRFLLGTSLDVSHSLDGLVEGYVG